MQDSRVSQETKRWKSQLRRAIMLVLTRRTDETIMIGDPKKPGECIEVVVVEVRGD